MSYVTEHKEHYGDYGKELYNLYKTRQINFEHFKFIHKSANRRGFTQYIKLFPDLELREIVFKYNETFNRSKSNKVYSIVKWKPPVKYFNIIRPFKVKNTFGILYATLVYVTDHRGFKNYI